MNVSYRALITGLWGLGLSGCFFFQSINSAPQAQVEKDTSGPHYRGDTITFSAGKSDDADGDSLKVSWAARTCSADGNSCDAPAFASMSTDDKYQLFDVDVPILRTGTAEATPMISVTVVVRDPRGAESEDTYFVEIFNRDPVLELQVQGFRSPAGGGYPIGTSMQVVAEASDPDGDQVTLAEWRLYPAAGSVPENVRWEEISDTVWELEPDVTGLWTVEVRAEDGAGGETITSEPILVQEDMPPCIASTDPRAVTGARYILDREDVARRFAVLSVTDDLDVYPAPGADAEPMGRASFRWFVATPDTDGQLVAIENYEVADYLVDAAAYAPGDRITLRVEIDDRVNRQLICGDQAPTCSLGGDECLQRVTWEAEVR